LTAFALDYPVVFIQNPHKKTIYRLAAMKNPFSLSLNPFSILSPLFFDIPNRDDPKILQIQSTSGADSFLRNGYENPGIFGVQGSRFPTRRLFVEQEKFSQASMELIWCVCING
jgi:hypothetical protein